MQQSESRVDSGCHTRKVTDERLIFTTSKEPKHSRHTADPRKMIPKNITVNQEIIHESCMPPKNAVRVYGREASDARFLEGIKEETATFAKAVEETTHADFLFPKRRVPSINEASFKGHFNSELHAALAALTPYACEESSTAVSSFPLEDIPDDSPPNSLLVQTSLFVPFEREFQATTSSSKSFPTVHQEYNPSSETLLQKIVSLFAGRKKYRSTKGHSVNNSAFTEAPQQAGDSNFKDPPLAAIVPTSTAPLKDRLTHAQVIPPILVTRSENISCCTTYKEVLSAPEHRYTGYAVVALDIYQPANVQRGFDAGDSSRHIAFTQQQKHPAGSLFDRDGDTWRNWHTKILLGKQKPFTQNPSCGEGFDEYFF